MLHQQQLSKRYVVLKDLHQSYKRKSEAVHLLRQSFIQQEVDDLPGISYPIYHLNQKYCTDNAVWQYRYYLMCFSLGLEGFFF